jgi:parallel beta-helix repeat protein
LILVSATIPLAQKVVATETDNSKTWMVDPKGGGDSLTIQAAVDKAKAGDTIYVKAGNYSEHVTVEKSLTLLGEDRNNTILDGTYTGIIISVNASNVVIQNFTFQNSGWEIKYGAVYVSGNSYNVTVSNNSFLNNEYGVCVDPLSWVKISNNIIIGNATYNRDHYESSGILMMSDYCTAKDNLIQNVTFGIMVNGDYNLIHNNTISGYFVYDGENYTGSLNGICTIGNDRIFIYAHKSTQNNTVTCNTIQNNDLQLALNNIKNWTIVQNNIMGGSGLGHSTPYYNQWDNGYPTGGNYYEGKFFPDMFRGVYQNITGSDGISDQNETFYENNIDHYPINHLITNFTITPTIPVPPYQTSIAPTNTPAPTTTSKPTATATPHPTSTTTPAPTQTPIKNKAPTKLAISCETSTNLTDLKAIFKGNLTSNEHGLSGVPVQFTYSQDTGLTWNNLTLTTTDKNGNLQVSWTPSSTGNYLIKAEYSGNATYERTTALVTFVVVPFSEKNIFSVTSNSTVSELTFSSANNQLAFNVSGPDGSTGYVQIHISKSLMTDNSKLNVLIDGNKVAYNCTSETNSWLISIAYHHSAHTVTVNLTAQTNASPPSDTIILIAIIIVLVAAISSAIVLTIKTLKIKP